MSQLIFVWGLKVWFVSHVKLFSNSLKSRPVSVDTVTTVATTFFRVTVLYAVPPARVTSTPMSAMTPGISSLVALLECYGFFVWVVGRL